VDPSELRREREGSEEPTAGAMLVVSEEKRKAERNEFRKSRLRLATNIRVVMA